MKSKRIYSIMLVTLIASVLSLGAVFAQEETKTCDSDLILSLYTAERFFDFSAYNSQMSADTMLDIDSIDKGQYASLFDDLNLVEVSDETDSGVMDMMMMDDASFNMQMGSSEMSLSEAVIEESAECAALRSSLRRFYSAIAMSELSISGMMGDGMMGSGDTDTPSSNSEDGAFTVALSGANEVPTLGDEDAAGTATVYLRSDSNEVCVDISIQNITFPTTAAHIHQAAVGLAGAPVVTLTAPDEAGLSSSCVTVDAALMQEMINTPENFYINVHNGEFPDGAARGQLR